MKGLLKATDEPCGRFLPRIGEQAQSCFICRHFAGCIALLSNLGIEVHISGKNTQFAGKTAILDQKEAFDESSADALEGANSPKEAKKGKKSVFERLGAFWNMAQKCKKPVLGVLEQMGNQRSCKLEGFGGK